MSEKIRKMIKKIVNKFSSLFWAIGFVEKGLEGVMHDDDIAVKWMKMPKDGWFADPFILDVKTDEIDVLVEDLTVRPGKGVISLLKIDRHSMELLSKKTILELPTHLSFPCILREGEKVYIYPENALSGKLDLYEYHFDTESVSFVKTICDDVVWDSCMTDKFGDKMLFTAAHDDYILDIYRYDGGLDKYVPWKQVTSSKRNSRMGGQLFEYEGNVYYPAQDCEKNYGSAIIIKKIGYDGCDFEVKAIKRITSMHPKMKVGFHTINEYKGLVVVDVCGYRYQLLGKLLGKTVGFLYNIKKSFRNR